ncbi:hypothetical protein CEXT_253181 [Caerostris extrusa]|uniref:Uncharacterized protein n=1 Tax=Caerostris extrusa TaxID=172846 RepID=A0AAV4WX61_CAEEX|nr:hypothetical protein CEXT_253181 [Caerostris extrusa]
MGTGTEMWKSKKSMPPYGQWASSLVLDSRPPKVRLKSSRAEKASSFKRSELAQMTPPRSSLCSLGPIEASLGASPEAAAFAF